MKKQLIAISAAAAVILSFSACGKDKSSVEISLSDGQDHLNLAIGQEINVVANTKDKNAQVEWSCSDDSVAGITSDGKLSGIANGIAVITATTSDGSYDHVGVVVGNGVLNSTSVPTANSGEGGGSTTPTVFNGKSDITSISLSLNGMTEDETLILSNNDEGTFKVNVIPADCKDPIVFSSSNASVVEVDNDGNVTPVSRGSATITATAPNGVNDTFKIFVR